MKPSEISANVLVLSISEHPNTIYQYYRRVGLVPINPTTLESCESNPDCRDIARIHTKYETELDT